MRKQLNWPERRLINILARVMITKDVDMFIPEIAYICHRCVEGDHDLCDKTCPCLCYGRNKNG